MKRKTPAKSAPDAQSKLSYKTPRCFLCDDTGSVCKDHPDRPWSGKYACDCGAPAAPCQSCRLMLARGNDVAASKA